MSAIRAVLFDASDRKNTKNSLNLNNSTKHKPIDKRKDPIKADEARRKLDTFIAHSSDLLYKVKAIFPFDLFPNEVRVDHNQVHVIMREFFFSASIYSIRIENIVEAVLDMGPFFATLHITDMSYGKNLITVKYLPKKQAKKLRRIIQGLMIVNKQNIDVKPLDNDELIVRLEQLGSASE